MDKLLSSRQVCEILSFSPVTLWRHVKKGACPPPLKLAGGQNRWPESEIRTLIESLPIGDAYQNVGHETDKQVA